jgi:hypothetical protein
MVKVEFVEDIFENHSARSVESMPVNDVTELVFALHKPAAKIGGAGGFIEIRRGEGHAPEFVEVNLGELCLAVEKLDKQHRELAPPVPNFPLD